MYTIFTLLFTIIIFRKNILRSPITAVFILAFLIKVAVPFYYFTKYSELSLLADVLASISIFIIIWVSVLKKSKSTLPINSANAMDMKKKYYITAMLLMPFAWVLFWLPALYEGVQLPLWAVFSEDHKIAHNLRVFITKETRFGFTIDFVGKVLFPILLLTLGFSLKKQNKSEKITTILLVIMTMIVSFSYFQKAFPFNLLLVFVLGLALGKSMTKGKWIGVAVICAVLLLLVGRLYGSDFTIGFLKFQDLFFRRLGRVPVIVYEAYIDYGVINGPKFLEYNYLLNKSPANPALPMVIYRFMEYGGSGTGWANGYFVGDAFINFGYAGVIFVSAFIGYIVRLGNTLIANERVNISFIVAMMSVVSFCMILPGNAFFAFSVLFFLVIFAVSRITNQIVILRSGKVILKTPTKNIRLTVR